MSKKALAVVFVAASAVTYFAADGDSKPPVKAQAAAPTPAAVPAAAPQNKADASGRVGQLTYLSLFHIGNHGSEVAANSRQQLRTNLTAACKDLEQKFKTGGHRLSVASCYEGMIISNERGMATCATRLQVNMNGSAIPIRYVFGYDRESAIIKTGEVVQQTGGENSIYLGPKGGGLFVSGRNLFCVTPEGKITNEQINMHSAWKKFLSSPSADAYRGPAPYTAEQKKAEADGPYIRCKSIHLGGGSNYLYQNKSQAAIAAMTSSGHYRAGMMALALTHLSPDEVAKGGTVRTTDNLAFQFYQSSAIYKQVLLYPIFRQTSHFTNTSFNASDLKPMKNSRQMLNLLGNAGLECRPSH